MPGIEDDFLIRVVGIDGCDHPPRRVITDDRADSDLDPELELVPARRKLTEEGLILADRLALIVKDRPAGTHPTRVYHRPAIDHWSRFRLGLPLYLTAKAVRVTEADLRCALLARVQGADVPFPRDSDGERRPPLGRVGRRGGFGVVEAVNIVDDPRRGVAEQGAATVCGSAAS